MEVNDTEHAHALYESKPDGGGGGGGAAAALADGGGDAEVAADPAAAALSPPHLAAPTVTPKRTIRNDQLKKRGGD